MKVINNDGYLVYSFDEHTGNYTWNTYNSSGQLTTRLSLARDANTYVARHYVYDESGREHIDNMLQETEDGNRPLRVCDSNGVIKAFKYDALGRLVSYTDNTGASAVWVYRDNGTVEYVYNASNPNEIKVSSGIQVHLEPYKAKQVYYLNGDHPIAKTHHNDRFRYAVLIVSNDEYNKRNTDAIVSLIETTNENNIEDMEVMDIIFTISAEDIIPSNYIGTVSDRDFDIICKNIKSKF